MMHQWNVLKLLNLRSGAFLARLERSECMLSATVSESDGHRIVGNATLGFVRKKKPLPAGLKIAFQRACEPIVAEVDVNPFTIGIK